MGQICQWTERPVTEFHKVVVEKTLLAASDNSISRGVCWPANNDNPRAFMGASFKSPPSHLAHEMGINTHYEH